MNNHSSNPLENIPADPGKVFQQLQVIERLEVGPVKTERRRLVAPYQVLQKGTSQRADLIYRYEEEVFEPGEAESQNLANMIAAQVALNYGLFCETIAFRGFYDEHDRHFLQQMAENTAREIYVKKFLEPNPFLIGGAAHLSVIKKNSYLNARLLFPDVDNHPPPAALRKWLSEPDAYAVLSSGGKDSLLSYGLMNELGREVHPLFGNESGRHWFTALNAYRYFQANIERTGRVWMNSDRLFAWMLRRLPFIRPDFANIRSDEYPVRLWTVAVFLFGVLPLLRKRHIGNVLIGNEYDTTWPDAFKGIAHYNGLFDQSRYFDLVLSEYYQKKGWNLHQFSILRPLSELLILKILVERYPDLQAQQVSCHAAHKQGARVYPCGRCEKCRRIIAMLMAFDADPTRCGYSADQIQYTLQNLAAKGLHQELAGIKQLLWMLSKKGLIELPEAQKKSLSQHREILKLRFHPDRSPIDSIPADLRKPLYRHLLQHSEGAVRHNGQEWIPFDPLTHESLLK